MNQKASCNMFYVAVRKGPYICLLGEGRGENDKEMGDTWIRGEPRDHDRTWDENKIKLTTGHLSTGHHRNSSNLFPAARFGTVKVSPGSKDRSSYRDERSWSVE